MLIHEYDILICHSFQQKNGLLFYIHVIPSSKDNGLLFDMHVHFVGVQSLIQTTKSGIAESRTVKKAKSSKIF